MIEASRTAPRARVREVRAERGSVPVRPKIVTLTAQRPPGVVRGQEMDTLRWPRPSAISRGEWSTAPVNRAGGFTGGLTGATTGTALLVAVAAPYAFVTFTAQLSGWPTSALAGT